MESGTTNDSNSKVSSMERQDMSAITIASRIPEFWTHMPRLWFVQLEGIIRSQKLGDVAKADLIITKLKCEALQQVSDILFLSPETNKYDALKERLLQVNEESADRQFQKLVSEMELGSQKPSFLLRRMRELGRNTPVSEKSLHSLWLARLPSNVRAVLAVSQDQDLENLAKMADKKTETIKTDEQDEYGDRGSGVQSI
ncbi:uncharacterized protein LOC111348227 [Spodoptera litura]|uniref:Uncharacterized protein LOC111348227 n=1 Tax=Spodoptera litura TaxID=69820 RepID=A0A9J7IKM6_SPOLT|nr:uncharacterized protein LOC111348227 [Spodoptera litura]